MSKSFSLTSDQDSPKKAKPAKPKLGKNFSLARLLQKGKTTEFGGKGKLFGSKFQQLKEHTL